MARVVHVFADVDAPRREVREDLFKGGDLLLGLACITEIASPHVQTASAVNPDFHEMHGLPAKRAQVAVVRIEIMPPLPNAGSLSASIEKLLQGGYLRLHSAAIRQGMEAGQVAVGFPQPWALQMGPDEVFNRAKLGKVIQVFKQVNLGRAKSFAGSGCPAGRMRP